MAYYVGKRLHNKNLTVGYFGQKDRAYWSR